MSERCLSVINQFIKQNHGFDFETNTYKTFSIVLGANNWENVLDTLNCVEISNFENLLHQYSVLRNKTAHIQIGVIINYTAPSQVIVDYNNLLSPILKIESEVRNL